MFRLKCKKDERKTKPDILGVFAEACEADISTGEEAAATKHLAKFVF